MYACRSSSLKEETRLSEEQMQALHRGWNFQGSGARLPGLAYRLYLGLLVCEMLEMIIMHVIAT